jgi:hypothetical protein
LDGWKDIRLGRADEFAEASEILASIELTANVRRHDRTTVTQRVSLYGTMRGVSPDASAAINCVLHKNIKPKDFLPAFLNAIVLVAAGVKLPDRFRAIVVGTKANPAERIRDLRPMDKESALSYLTTVVGDLLSVGNDYFLPIEAVAEVIKQSHKGDELHDPVETVDGVRINEFASNSSQYGPVRNGTDFEPPNEEKIGEIIARRFDPISGIFR